MSSTFQYFVVRKSIGYCLVSKKRRMSLRTDLRQLGRDSASSKIGYHMELPAVTKPTDANFIRIIRKKASMHQGWHKRFYRYMLF